MGRKSAEIAELLGFRGRDEMIHRDDLVLLRSGDGSAAAPRHPRSRCPDECAHGRRDRMRADGGARARGGRRPRPCWRSRPTRRRMPRWRRRRRRCARSARRSSRPTSATWPRRAARHLSAARLDRLRLDERRVEAIAASIEAVIALPDPIGTHGRASGSGRMGCGSSACVCRSGVIGIIYESRPNVTADAGRAVPEVRQRGHPARRLGEPALEPRAARVPGARACRRRRCRRPASSWCRPPIAPRSATCSPA